MASSSIQAANDARQGEPPTYVHELLQELAWYPPPEPDLMLDAKTAGVGNLQIQPREQNHGTNNTCLVFLMFHVFNCFFWAFDGIVDCY